MTLIQTTIADPWAMDVTDTHTIETDHTQVGDTRRTAAMHVRTGRNRLAAFITRARFNLRVRKHMADTQAIMARNVELDAIVADVADFAAISDTMSFQVGK